MPSLPPRPRALLGYLLAGHALKRLRGEVWVPGPTMRPLAHFSTRTLRTLLAHELVEETARRGDIHTYTITPMGLHWGRTNPPTTAPSPSISTTAPTPMRSAMSTSNPASTMTPEAIRAAAHDARALLDLWSTLDAAHPMGGRDCTRHIYPTVHYHLPFADRICFREQGTICQTSRRLDFAAIQYAVQAACLRRGWDWGVGPANSTEHGYHGPAVGAWVDGWHVDMRTTERAPALALLASHLLALIAARDA